MKGSDPGCNSWVHSADPPDRHVGVVPLNPTHSAALLFRSSLPRPLLASPRDSQTAFCTSRWRASIFNSPPLFVVVVFFFPPFFPLFPPKENLPSKLPQPHTALSMSLPPTLFPTLLSSLCALTRAHTCATPEKHSTSRPERSGGANELDEERQGKGTTLRAEPGDI